MSVYIDASYAPTYSANNPVIGANSATLRGIPTASSEVDGYAATNAADPATTAYWRPDTGNETWELTVTVDETFSYCGIAAHNLGGVSAQIDVEAWDGAAWVNLGTATPTDDSAIMFLFGEYTTSRVRIVTTGLLQPTIGVITFGQALELPRRTYQGYVPIDVAQDAKITSNLTRTGNFVSRSVEFTGRSNQFTVSNIPEDWIRANFIDFMQESLYRPFFLAERPQDYSDAVDYCQTPAAIQPSRSGPLNYMTVAL